MLVNGVHLLPDASGALWWPGERLLVVADLLPDTRRRAPAGAARSTAERLQRLLRLRQPRLVVCLGGAAGLEHLATGCTWTTVEGEAETTVGALTFRHQPRPDAAPGEIAGQLRPAATLAGESRPCFLGDGRRLVLPGFGPQPGGLDAADARWRALFRRGFTAVVLDRERIRTVPHHRLEGAGPRPERKDGPSAGRRMNLFSE